MELSSSDVLGLMVAASTDEATTERLHQLHATLAKIESARTENEKIAEESGRDKNEAARLVAVAETRHQNAAGKERLVGERERALADVQATIQAEKAAWEKVRQQVDVEQKVTAGQLLKREVSLDQREHAVALKEETVAEREEIAARLYAHAEAKIIAMRAALDAVAEPETKK